MRFTTILLTAALAVSALAATQPPTLTATATDQRTNTTQTVPVTATVRDGSGDPVADIGVILNVYTDSEGTPVDDDRALVGVTDGEGEVTFDVGCAQACRAVANGDRYHLLADTDDDRRWGSAGDVSTTVTVKWTRDAPDAVHELTPGNIRSVDLTARSFVAYTTTHSHGSSTLLHCYGGCPVGQHTVLRWDEDDTYLDGLDEIDRPTFEARLEARDLATPTPAETGEFRVDYRPNGSSTWRLRDPRPYGQPLPLLP